MRTVVESITVACTSVGGEDGAIKYWASNDGMWNHADSRAETNIRIRKISVSILLSGYSK